MSLRSFVIGAVLLFMAWHTLDALPFRTKGVLAPDTPEQGTVPQDEGKSWTYRGYKIVPLATYSLTARVMHRDDYYLDHEAAVSPFDLALGWGRMSDPAVYDRLSIGQAWRWYTWHWSGSPPIPEDEIIRSSANTHIIPASEEIRKQLYWVRAGDVVKLSGYLVEVDGADGWKWKSSLSREDTGDGSCELLWVKEAEKVGR